MFWVLTEEAPAGRRAFAVLILETKSQHAKDKEHHGRVEQREIRAMAGKG
jgi:hypothetical protein